MEEQLLHEFDDWELRSQDDKGKHPMSAESEEEEEEEEQEEVAVQTAGGSGGGVGVGGVASAGNGQGEEAGPQSPRGSEPGELTCAICLGGIPLENMAMVKGCDHMYCATCILHWALHKEDPWCPQCKQPFNMLLTYRSLDGELHDFPFEESVCLLKRARWFEEHLRFVDQGSASLVEESRLADQMAWQDYAADYDLAEDEEIESFYFSSAAGAARVVLGNRRHGEGGFISGGRRQARPVSRKRNNKKGKSVEHAVPGMPPVPPPASHRTPNANGGRKSRPGSTSGASVGASTGASSSTPVPFNSAGADFYGSSPNGAGGSAVYGSSPSGSGRRARRNARRAAMDAGIEVAAGSWGGRA